MDKPTRITHSPRLYLLQNPGPTGCKLWLVRYTLGDKKPLHTLGP